MDSGLRQTCGKIDFTFITQETADNIVMRATRLSIVDCVYSKTQFLLATLRILNQLRVESCVSLEAEHLSPSVGCTSIISMDAGLRMDVLLVLDLRDVVIEVLRSTNSTIRLIRLAPGNWCWTGNHSSNETKTTTPTGLVSGNRDVVDHVPTISYSCQGKSHLYIFW